MCFSHSVTSVFIPSVDLAVAPTHALKINCNLALFAFCCSLPHTPLIWVYQRCTPQTRPCLLHSCVCGNRFSSVSLLLQNGALILSQRQGSRPYSTHVQLGLQRVSLLQLIWVLLELSELYAHAHSPILHYCPLTILV